MGRQTTLGVRKTSTVDLTSNEPWGKSESCASYQEIKMLEEHLLSNKISDNEYAASKIVKVAERYCNYVDLGIGWYVFCIALNGTEEEIYGLEEVLSSDEYDASIQEYSDATAHCMISETLTSPEQIASALLLTKYVEHIKEKEALELILDEWIVYINPETECPF